MTVPPRMTTPKYPSVSSMPPKPPEFNKPPVKRRSPYRPIILVMLAGFLTALLIVLVGNSLISKTVYIPLPSFMGSKNAAITIKPPAPGEKIVLIMGVDHANPSKSQDYSFDGARTDTMMLARISTRSRSLSLVSIPRDSKVYLADGRGTDKINAAHALGGPDLAVATVQDSFGVPVDNYVVINFSGVKQLVDTLGGVDIYVEKRMRYRDNTAKLNINFDQGYHHLNGQQAEEFLRFRHDELGDIGRIRRQQQFVNAVTKRLKDPWVFSKIPELVNIGSQYVKTDLSLNEMVRLAAFVPDIEFEKMRTATLPGRPSGGSISYWLVDSDSAQAILDRLILENNNHLYQGVDQSKPVRVGVFYDPGYQAQLPALIAGLEQASFEVVCKQSYRKSSTQIIEHSNRVTTEMTRRLEETSPSLKRARLIFAPVGSTYEVTSCSSGEDYTIIVGADAVKAN